MKKLSVIVLLAVMFSGSIYAQKSIIGDKSVSKKFARNGLSKSIILSRAETWFLNEDNANKNKVDTIDIEKGLIKINGETKVLYKNIGKELYPKRSAMAEVLEARFGHIMEINVNEEDYDIMYTVIDMKEEMYKKQDVFFECVNFKEINEEDLSEYNKAMDKLLKANLVFKKRREVFAENSRSQFEEVSSFLLNEGQVNIFSLNEVIISE
jgi:DNA repair exonuclease SbcCD nuclease subunit